MGGGWGGRSQERIEFAHKQLVLLQSLKFLIGNLCSSCPQTVGGMFWEMESGTVAPLLTNAGSSAHSMRD